MPRTKNGSLPSYRLHKPTGQAVVTLDGKDHYLGPHGSLASKQKYQRLLDAWLARRNSPLPLPSDPELAAPPAADGPSVNELILAFVRHADAYYQPADSGERKEANCIRDALRLLRPRYGPLPAASFGPRALKEVRAVMIEKGWARSYINHQVDRIRRMFRWATEEELIPATVYHALRAVRGLRKGLPGVRESKKVRPVRLAHVKAVLPHLSPMLRALVLFQLHTGCRPGEALRLRPGRIDRSSPLWVYRPRRHKTAHHGQVRRIFIGPRAQKVLTRWLRGLTADAYVFSPVRAEAERQARRRARRKTPLWPSHQKRQAERRRRPAKRPKRERYDVASYRRAVRRACRRAGVPAWSPNQLRHAAATRIRRRHGSECARIILGHTTAFTTEIYAEADRRKAMEVVRAMG